MPAVILDFDGLMVDSEYEIASCVVGVLAARGATITIDEIAHLFGSTDLDDDWEALLDGLFDGSFTMAQLEAELGNVLPARMEALPLLPGVEKVIAAAETDGWPVGLATGQVRARLDQHLTRLGLDGRFDAIVTREEVARGKPAPDIYLETARRLEVLPGECVAVEDSLPGCQAALDAGMAVVVCPSRVTARCDFPSAALRIGCLDELRLSLALARRGGTDELS